MFAEAYYNTSPGTTSDIRAKNSIQSYSNNYEIFFDLLKPRIFKYNSDKKELNHFGFIAQDILNSMQKSKIKENGIISINPMTNLYSIKYSEFISLNTWQIQKLKKRVAELEQEIKEIKQ